MGAQAETRPGPNATPSPAMAPAGYTAPNTAAHFTAPRSKQSNTVPVRAAHHISQTAPGHRARHSAPRVMALGWLRR